MPAEPSCERPAPIDHLADVLWRRLDHPSLEHCRLLHAAESFLLQGCVLTSAAGTPLRVDYVVVCGPDWTTRQVNVRTTHGQEYGRLDLRRDESGAWRREGEALAGCDDLIDVDLAITPATNTLPIRRLAPAVGSELSIDALWVQFPGLSVERLPQTYTRTGERHYLYQSRGGSFRAELDVDDEGLVTRYGNLWERVAP